MGCWVGVGSHVSRWPWYWLRVKGVGPFLRFPLVVEKCNPGSVRRAGYCSRMGGGLPAGAVRRFVCSLLLFLGERGR